jgi:adenine-specific DNA-methyltransferase
MAYKTKGESCCDGRQVSADFHGVISDYGKSYFSSPPASGVGEKNDSLIVTLNVKKDAILLASSIKNIEKRNRFACAFCEEVARNYWKLIRKFTGVKWKFRHYGDYVECLPDGADKIAHKFVSVLWPHHGLEAGYQISLLYASLLHPDYCFSRGVFYTPMSIVRKMIDISATHGIDFKTAKVIDPSSGGAAFLSPLCRRMIDLERFPNPNDAVNDLTHRLKGVEVDPFAAWLSQFLLDCELALIVPSARRPRAIVQIADALRISENEFGVYDMVIGNPPYGKIPIDPFLKERYEESLYGHVNIYQLFYHLGFLLAGDRGIVHFLTPTSFLGGHYFNRLRKFIGIQSWPTHFEFIKNREGVFEGVQQEVIASLFRKGIRRRKTKVFVTDVNEQKTLMNSVKTGYAVIGKGYSAPWKLPRDAESGRILQSLPPNLGTLKDLGFRATTGYFVWNRNQERICSSKRGGVRPLIWSESIRSDGVFDFKRAIRKGRSVWVNPKGIENNLVTAGTILVKRTTNKEQKRRLYPAVVSKEFAKKYKGFFVENHVNLIVREEDSDLKEDTLARFLGTRVVDTIFRCMSGTVAVSVSELMRLSMPDTESLMYFQELIECGEDEEIIEGAAEVLYGIR